MAIYKTRWFNRWAHKQRLDDLSLCAAVREMTAGLYDANELMEIDCDAEEEISDS